MAAVNSGNTQFGHPLAPAAVGQNHRFCHDQIQGGAALAGRDKHFLVALGWCACIANELEVVVGAVKGFWFATHDFTLGLEVFGKAVQESQVRVYADQRRRRIVRIRAGKFKPLGCDHTVELVVAQIVGNRDKL